MSFDFDTSHLAEELAALGTHPNVRKLAVVLPLVPGKREVAWEFLREGPPFDLERAGVEAHEVLLTDTEAIFVFGVPEGPESLERMLSAEDFWTMATAWGHIASGPPRLARVAFDWPR